MYDGSRMAVPQVFVQLETSYPNCIYRSYFIVSALSSFLSELEGKYFSIGRMWWGRMKYLQYLDVNIYNFFLTHSKDKLCGQVLSMFNLNMLK